MIFLSVFIMAGSCQSNSDSTTTEIAITSKEMKPTAEKKNLDNLSTAYFASGCFWCVEAIYESIKGVEEAVSGYSGGTEKNPTYHNMGSHAEVVKVYYDSSVVDFPTLVKAYYGSQDPTTYGQAPDFGSHYRSIIFYQNETEKQLAQKQKDSLNTSGKYSKPVVTEIQKFEVFYKAEDYHQNYEKLNPNQPYVKSVSIPRLRKFQKKFAKIVKDDAH